MSKNRGRMKNQKWRVKIRFLLPALIIAGGSLYLPYNKNASADSCPDLRIIFARGSGAERNTSGDYLEFKNRIEEKLTSVSLGYEFIDLDYPAVGVGFGNLGVAVGALFGAGEAHEFGESVNSGVQKLTEIVNDSCKTTKYVLGGYSQGAMVVSKSLPSLSSDKIIYAATFGDPKLYLPEGKGIIPPACRGDNLSDYRMYVPDCQAYKGLLGAYIPYEPGSYEGKLGTWCNKRDIFCSSHLNIDDHLGYVSDNLYEDASRVIVSKITDAFGIENHYTSPHDTAILIDSTGSMEWLIDQFKNEATRLANETFEAGGRVALYDYRDLRDPYEPVARCDFETCTADNFRSYLDEIVVYGGGDEPESLLSASHKVMTEQKWQYGATKSLVVLTDAPFLSPDIDMTTVDDVVAMSKTIDPVNMYIITNDWTAELYPEMTKLAEATGGMLTTELGSLNLLTDYIMDRYDTLPRVEEIVDDSEAPTLEIVDMVDNGENVTVKFDGENTGAIVILNDAVLGIVYGDSVTITSLKRKMKNNLSLVPINDDRKGEAVEIEIPTIYTWGGEVREATEDNDIDPEIFEEAEDGFGGDFDIENIIVPKAPDTGVIK